MAYGAVGCLELTVERFLESSHISIVQNSSPQILKHLYDEILSFKEALREFDKRRSTVNMKTVKTLEAKIIDVVYKFEDVIESHVLDQIHSQSDHEEVVHPPLMLVSVDVQEIKQDVDSFIQTLNKMKKAYIHELHNPSPDEEEEDDVVPAKIDFVGNESNNMIGLSHLFMIISCRLNYSRSERMTVSLFGMAGIGKTTLAKKLFQYPSIVSHFRTRVFVTIGPKYQFSDILVDILRQLKAPDIDEVVLMESKKVLGELKRMVLKSLNNLRYLIVFDDVWYTELWDDLAEVLPDDNNGSRVLLTTRLKDVAQSASQWNNYRLSFLDKKKSWDLFREKVFGEQESFSYELEKAGKKIAENCEGLPLAIVTIAAILSKVDKTVEYWNEVADDKKNSVYKDAYDQMSNVLYPSYDYLEQHLKACFLYLGASPQNYFVYGYQLTNLCSAEGFLSRKPIHYSDTTATLKNDSYGYLDELCSKNVFMYAKQARGYHLHSAFWYLCNKEAANTKLFYVLNCRADALPEEGQNYQRRLCIRNNVLFGIKDVYDSMAFVTMVRSLLCTGPYHKYSMPSCFLEHLRLLRVLHALRTRFYEFPMEVVKLVHLRYLAITYNGNLPPSISKLLNLQYLIVSRHLRIIKSSGNLLPLEIWNMKELKYLQTMGRDLPHPCHKGFVLPNLLELTRASHQSCTKDILERIPNLEALDIQIELAPDATDPLSCFDHISHLRRLKLLSCAIMNPTLKRNLITPLAPLSDFPLSLTKLTLSGLGYPWEEMRKISSLPNLTHLFLKCYAFRGPKWEVRENEFKSLVDLEIEDIDLEQWKFVASKNSCLPAVDTVSIAHCYKLKEIPLTFGRFLEKIDLIDCNPMGMNCANTLKTEWDDKYGGHGQRSLLLRVRSSL